MKNLILISVLFVFGISRSYALFGVGDTVIVAANPAQEIFWATTELPKWAEAIKKAQEQVENTREMIDVVGHPEKFADAILSKSTAAMAASEGAAALKTGGELIELTEKSWALGKSVDGLSKDVLSVGDNYSTFGKTVSRDKGRYIQMAKEKALRAQVEKAMEARRKVDKQEFEFQKKTQDALKSAKTQTEIELHQAALQASQQRQELARSKVEGAQQDLQNFKDDQELENRKLEEMAKEEEEAHISQMRTWQEGAANAGGGYLTTLPLKEHYSEK